MAKLWYRVTGEFRVAGHEKGEEFEHDFGDQADVLIEGGHIEPATKGKATAEPKETKED